MIIYKITNRITNKSYVGQTVRPLEKRIQAHRWASSKASMLITRAIHKYGWENFEVEVLCECSSLQELNAQEVRYVQSLKTLAPEGYNLRAGGGGLGVSSPETRKKISDANKGRRVSEATRQLMSASHKGQRCSEEKKAHLRQVNKGKKSSKQANLASALASAKTFTLTNPSGDICEITNLKDFCKQNNLCYIAMHGLTSGRHKHHKGWTNPTPVETPAVQQPRPRRSYHFLSPGGDPVEVRGLKQFCLEQGLGYTAMVDLHSGSRKSYKGWRAVKAKEGA